MGYYEETIPKGERSPLGRTFKLHCDSIADMCAVARQDMARNSGGHNYMRGDGSWNVASWFGNLSPQGFLDAATGAGLPEIVKDMQNYIDHVEASGILSHGRPVVTTDLVGFRPCVPKLLSGEPDSMFTIKRAAGLTEGAPLRVFVDICASSGLDAATMRRRGAAIMALVWILADRRAVELYAYASLGNLATGSDAHIPVVSLGVAPLDPAANGLILAHAATLRRFCMAWADRHGFQGGWAWGRGPDDDRHRDAMRLVLGAEPTDLVIHGAHLNNPEIRKPKDWLMTMVREHAGLVEDL